MASFVFEEPQLEVSVKYSKLSSPNSANIFFFLMNITCSLSVWLIGSENRNEDRFVQIFRLYRDEWTLLFCFVFNILFFAANFCQKCHSSTSSRLIKTKKVNDAQLWRWYYYGCLFCSPNQIKTSQFCIYSMFVSPFFFDVQPEWPKLIP